MGAFDPVLYRVLYQTSSVGFRTSLSSLMKIFNNVSFIIMFNYQYPLNFFLQEKKISIYSKNLPKAMARFYSIYQFLPVMCDSKPNQISL